MAEDATGISGQHSGGSGSKLPLNVLWAATVSAGVATVLSFWCIVQQLRNYRKPILQRFVVRILFMVPIYSISTLISLYSLQAAFFIDLIRDMYEAFVIYCFFGLLVEYLGGERSLLILLHGRKPTPHPWPVSKFFSPIDISDPYTFLNIKRGIFQYVQVKPILVILTMIFKATETYNDGNLKFTSGYTYVSLAYNFSVSLCLYCLAAFWMCTGADLKPFRPMPKFLCIKGVIFFSFWQGFGISILVALGLLKSSRYSTETLSLAIQDTLICFEMPIFSILHLYAFSHKDFIEPNVAYCGRLPFVYAFRDSIVGFKDVLEDSLITLRGSGFSYKTFEPSEGALHHQGIFRERRVRAGLRYSAGGKQKYWLPMPGADEGCAHGRKPTDATESRITRWKSILNKVNPAQDHSDLGYAPLLPEQAADVVHEEGACDDEGERRPLTDHLMAKVGRWDLRGFGYGLTDIDVDEGSDLDEVSFGEPRREEELLYRDARRLTYGDYNNPVVDASQEEVSRLMRAREDGMLASHPAAPSSKKGKARLNGPDPQDLPPSLLSNEPRSKTSIGSKQADKQINPETSTSRPKIKSKSTRLKTKKHHALPEGCVDLLIEDRAAMERRTKTNRLKGEANRFTGVSPEKVFKVIHPEVSLTHGDSLSLTTDNPTTKDRRDSKTTSNVDFSINAEHEQNPGSEEEAENDSTQVQMIVNMEDDLQATQIDQDPHLEIQTGRYETPNGDLHHLPADETKDEEAEQYTTKKQLHLSTSLSTIIRNPWDW